MSIEKYVSTVDAAILAAEACLEKHDFREFMYQAQESCRRRIESLEVNNSLSFLKFFDEE